ncbi:hypothetical protein [Campylobacter sputorum]|uniref:hypothetical protein n=1 Tax=Campylobacter sputorum TaxID=206 RepID=UPI00053BE929|nr:hypothetical protein [Campylobacter sputorum]
MVDFILTFIESFEWISFFIGFISGGAVVFFLQSHFKPYKQNFKTTCTIKENSNIQKVGVYIHLANNEPKMIHCPYFDKKPALKHAPNVKFIKTYFDAFIKHIKIIKITNPNTNPTPKKCKQINHSLSFL